MVLNNKYLKFLSLVVCIFFYFYFLSKIEYENILSLKFDPILYITPIILISFIATFLRYIRWKIILSIFGRKIKETEKIKIFLVGLSLNFTPANVGENIRALYLKKFNISFKNSLLIFIISKFSDFIAIFILCLLLGAYLLRINTLNYVIPIEMIIKISMFTFVIIILLFVFFKKKINKEKYNISRYIKEKIPYLTSNTVYKSISLTFFIWIIDFLCITKSLDYFNIEYDVLILFYFFILAIMVGAISFMPGSLGSFEFILMLLLSSYYENINHLIIPIYSGRIISVLTPILIGGLSFLFFKIQKRRANK